MRVVPNSVCFNGTWIAEEVEGRFIVQDDGGRFWELVPVKLVPVEQLPDSVVAALAG